jgi:hypothetical protein
VTTVTCGGNVQKSMFRRFTYESLVYRFMRSTARAASLAACSSTARRSSSPWKKYVGSFSASSISAFHCAVGGGGISARSFWACSACVWTALAVILASFAASSAQRPSGVIAPRVASAAEPAHPDSEPFSAAVMRWSIRSMSSAVRVHASTAAAEIAAPGPCCTAS